MNSATTVPGSSCNKGLLEEQRSLTQRTFWFLEFQIPWNSPEAATDMHLVEASRFVRIRPFRLSYEPFRHFFLPSDHGPPGPFPPAKNFGWGDI